MLLWFMLTSLQFCSRCACECVEHVRKLDMARRKCVWVWSRGMTTVRERERFCMCCMSVCVCVCVCVCMFVCVSVCVR